MMERLTGDIDISGIKRCYLEGASLEVECPTCGEMMVHSFSDQYLMYPQVNTGDSIIFSCDPCHEEDEVYGNYTEWELPISIISAKIEIEYDLKELKEC
jgi:predicted RNA-binding Zn-ribbon protein involved in translation (DUF1610 family)